MRHKCGVFGLLVVLVGVLCFGQQAQYAPPSGVKFEVVTTRVLSAEESMKRSPSDVFGLNLVIRLRLSCSERGLYFYAAKDPVSVVPRGHDVKLTENGIVWRHGLPVGNEQRTSPGIEMLNSIGPGEWVWLPAHTTVEWEKLDSTTQVLEMRAYTIFIKERRDDTPREILSDSFEVPTTPPLIR
jgi:hypothetical protein